MQIIDGKKVTVVNQSYVNSLREHYPNGFCLREAYWLYSCRPKVQKAHESAYSYAISQIAYDKGRWEMITTNSSYAHIQRLTQVAYKQAIARGDYGLLARIDQQFIYDTMNEYWVQSAVRMIMVWAVKTGQLIRVSRGHYTWPNEP